MARTTPYGTADVTPAGVVAGPTVVESLRRLSWSAVIGGVVISLITQFLLSMLGVGIGVSTLEPLQGGSPSAETFSISAGIWWTVSGIISAFVGGWVAGRLSGTPYTAAATLHGLVTWATTMLVVFYLLTSAAGAFVGGAFGVLGQFVSGAGDVLKSAVPQLADATSGPLGDLRREIEGTVRGDQSSTAKTQAVSSVIRVVTGGNNVSQADRDQAANLLAQQAGISQDEARNRLAQWSETYQRSAAQAEQQARAAADASARVVSRAAIYGFIALVLGAIAGAIGGRAGYTRETTVVTTD